MLSPGEDADCCESNAANAIESIGLNRAEHVGKRDLDFKSMT